MGTQFSCLPRIMLAAPRSGSGKTLLTCAVLRILQKQKIRTVSFKCGPDYIDPMFHRQVLGIPSRNLDLFLAGEKGVTESVMKWGARAGGPCGAARLSSEPAASGTGDGAVGSGTAAQAVSVIEGVMGYFDGIGATGTEASSYDLARVTGTPVILVVDVRGMARSAVPLIRGFAAYGDYHGIRGVLLNRVSPMTYPPLRELIERETGLKVLGGMPVLEEAVWESRHLGLLQPEEIRNVRGQIDMAAEALGRTLDLGQLLQIAYEADDGAFSAADGEWKRSAGNPPGRHPEGSVRIGAASDAAFTFYYDDNLDLLRGLGAELVPFSPLKDDRLPEVDGLLLGGGYPELHLRELSGNDSMRRSVRRAAEAGMPILAECGGFQYLQQAVIDHGGKRFPMAGVLPGESRMTGHLVRFGYIECKPAAGPAARPAPLCGTPQTIENECYVRDTQGNGRSPQNNLQNNPQSGSQNNPQSGLFGSRGNRCEDKCSQAGSTGFLSPGHSIRGHEFHYSDSTENGAAWRARKPSGSREWDCMVCSDTITAGYPHLYYPSDPAFAENFVQACRRFRAARADADTGSDKGRADRI